MIRRRRLERIISSFDRFGLVRRFPAQPALARCRPACQTIDGDCRLSRTALRLTAFSSPTVTPLRSEPLDAVSASSRNGSSFRSGASLARNELETLMFLGSPTRRVFGKYIIAKQKVCA